MSVDVEWPDDPFEEVEVFGTGHHGLVINQMIDTPAGPVPSEGRSDTYYYRNPEHPAVVRNATQAAFDAEHGLSWPNDRISPNETFMVCDEHGDVWKWANPLAWSLTGVKWGGVLDEYGVVAIPPATYTLRELTIPQGEVTLAAMGLAAVATHLGTVASVTPEIQGQSPDGRKICVRVLVEGSTEVSAAAFVEYSVVFGSNGVPVSVQGAVVKTFAECSLTTETVSESWNGDALIPGDDPEAPSVSYGDMGGSSLDIDERVTVLAAGYSPAGDLSFITWRRRVEISSSNTSTYEVSHDRAWEYAPNNPAQRALIGLSTGMRTDEAYSSTRIREWYGWGGTEYLFREQLSVFDRVDVKTGSTNLEWNAAGTGAVLTYSGSYQHDESSSSDRTEGPVDWVIPPTSESYGFPAETSWSDAVQADDEPHAPVLTNTSTVTYRSYFGGMPDAIRMTNNVLQIYCLSGDNQRHWWTMIAVDGSTHVVDYTTEPSVSWNPRTGQFAHSATDTVGWI